MPDLQIIPPEESEQDSPFGRKVLRIGAIFLSVIFGTTLLLFGYFLAITLDLDYVIFTKYAAECFYVCFALWILIGSIMPFALFQSFFEGLRGVNFARVLLYVVVFGILVFLHWYVITMITEILVSIFGD